MASASAKAGIPRALPVESFAAAREPELRALLRAGIPDGDPTLPRHLRRRAGSHWRRRVKRRPNAATRAGAGDREDPSSETTAGRPTNRRMRRARGRLAEAALEASCWCKGDLVDRAGEEKGGERAPDGDGKAQDAGGEAAVAAGGEGGDVPSPALSLPSSRVRRIPSHLWHAKRFAMGCPFPGLQWRLPIAAFAARTRKVRTAGGGKGRGRVAGKRKGRGTAEEGTVEEDEEAEVATGDDSAAEDEEAEVATGDDSAAEDKRPRSGEEETAEPTDSDEGSDGAACLDKVSDGAANSDGGMGGEADDAGGGSAPRLPRGLASGLAASAALSAPRFPRCAVHDGGYFCPIALDPRGIGAAENGSGEASQEAECPLVLKLIALCCDASTGKISTPSGHRPPAPFVSRGLAPGIAATVSVGPGKSEPGAGPSAGPAECTLWAHAAVAAPLWRALAASRALARSAPRPLPLGLLQLRGPDADAALAWLAGSGEEGERVVGNALPPGSGARLGVAAPGAASGEAAWVRLCDPRLRGLPASVRGLCRIESDGQSDAGPAENSPAASGAAPASSALSAPISLETLSRGPAPHPEALVSTLRQRCRLQALGAYAMPAGAPTAAELAGIATGGDTRGTLPSSRCSLPAWPPADSVPWTWALATRVAPPRPLPSAVLPRLEGWDVALPPRWVAPLLAALASRGAEVAGQERWQDVHAVGGAAWFDGKTGVDVVRRMLRADKGAEPSSSSVPGDVASTTAAAAPREGRAGGAAPERSAAGAARADPAPLVSCWALLRPVRRGHPRVGAAVSFPSEEGAAAWARPRDAPEIRWSGDGEGKQRRGKSRKGVPGGRAAPSPLSPRLDPPCGSVLMACPAGCAFKAKWARALVRVAAAHAPAPGKPLEERLAFFQNPDSHVAFPCRLVLLRDEYEG